MTKQIEKLDVIFRVVPHGKFKGEVTAFFPSIAADRDYSNCQCYAHVGQHGSASYGFYKTQRLATPAEYADLLSELKGIYESEHYGEPVELVVKTRWTAKHDKAQLAELKRTF